MIRNPTSIRGIAVYFVFGGIYMFEKEGQRFLTPGIKEGVPLEVQLLLWHLIDTANCQMDYLQIFELHKENHANKLIIIHRQEEPEQKRKVTFQLGKYAKELQVLPRKIWVIDDGDHQTMLLPEEY
ncbi:TPA: DUF960 domain-containing protein [Listeria monocytogenes]